MTPLCNVKVRLRVDISERKIRIMDELHSVRVNTSFKMVYWKPPNSGCLKGNTNGVLKINPSPSSIAFCIRDQHGNLFVAQGNRIRDTTSLKAKSMAIKECLKYCKRSSINQLILKTDY